MNTTPDTPQDSITKHSAASWDEKSTLTPRRQRSKGTVSVARVIYFLCVSAIIVVLACGVVGDFVPDTAFGRWTAPLREFLGSIGHGFRQILDGAPLPPPEL